MVLDFFCMDQREFNRQMGSYLRERKSGDGLWKRLKDKLPSVTIVDDEEEQPAAPAREEVPVEQVEAVMRGESLPEEESDEEEFAEYEEMEESSKSFFERLREFLFGSYEKHELLHDEEDVDVAVITERAEQPRVDEDVKEMLRVCIKWINRLPADEIQAIKREDEYREFKRLLEKYGLLKK